MRRFGAAALGATSALVVLRLWVMPLPSSLWLDEFGTVWVTDGGLGGVAARARLFPQSLPYAALVAVVRAAAGSSEIVLRLPSLVAMLVALGLVCRLGRLAFGREAGLLGAGVFLLSPQAEFAASDARPYALAVLFSTAALVALGLWLRSGRARDGIAYVLASAAAVYCHYLFAASLAAHAFFVLDRVRRGTPVSRRAIAGAAAGLAVLLLPAAVLVTEIGGRRTSHAFGTMPSGLGLLNGILPVRVLGLLVPAAALCFLLRIARGFRGRPAAADGEPSAWFPLLVAAALAPAILLFAASRLLGTPLFEGRYLLASLAPWAALLGGAASRLEPEGAGRTTVAGALALALVLRGEPRNLAIAHGREDWRAALARLAASAPEAPVLLGGSFAEAQDLELVADPGHQDYLVAPVRYYAPAREAVALPLGASEAAVQAAERIAAPALASNRFALVERSSRFPSWSPWLDAAAGRGGLVGREIYRGGPLSVRLYERPGAGSAEGGTQAAERPEMSEDDRGTRVDRLHDHSVGIDLGSLEVDAAAQLHVERAAPLADGATHDRAGLRHDGSDRELREILDHHGSGPPLGSGTPAGFLPFGASFKNRAIGGRGAGL